ncbi:MAG TPA: NAD(P)/FAD-dependent oxidoreductase [Candidatus Saccharimonadales bacterium]|jgi:protoporphyrinogen oxidase|nr:NAD(P)/FAD-dependent oxidoreductase [Candidatus Saccharimonadales bacterium]
MLPSYSEPDSNGRLHVGIIGGGITGLTAAFYLLRAGHQVTIIESRGQIGGLATYQDFGPFCWDRFYHCILTSDQPLLHLIDDLGLGPELCWTETKVGFFTGHGLHSFTTTLDFLRFPAISLWDKFRLGIGILYTSRIRDGRALESKPIGPWMTKVFGRGNYRKLWEPLLKCKLGEARHEASASFIWATIRRLYSTRDKGASKKECLGYVRGGYRTVFARLVQQIQGMGGIILTETPVERVYATGGGDLAVTTGKHNRHFDYVIGATPSSAFAAMAPELDEAYRRKLQRTRYMGMVCVALLLRRKLTPYYCTNLIQDLPFTGIIEMTNLISMEETYGRHLVYLPKYTSPSDPLFQAGDREIWESFRKGLQQVIPDLQEDDIEKKFIFRERFVQPIQEVGFADFIPEMQTGIPRLLLANTSQIVNSTLNNNEMVRIARQAVDRILTQAQDGPGAGPPPEIHEVAGILR